MTIIEALAVGGIVAIAIPAIDAIKSYRKTKLWINRIDMWLPPVVDIIKLYMEKS